jgi:hypothetical protein
VSWFELEIKRLELKRWLTVALNDKILSGIFGRYEKETVVGNQYRRI